MNNDVPPIDPLDPSSISLFSTSNNDYGKPTTSSASNNLTNSLTTANGTIEDFGRIDEKIKKPSNYSTYASGRATEVAKRRNLNERIDKLKSKHGILFNVPQCNSITLNQMAIFLRRLRKYPNIRGLMSSELMLKIFQEDADVKLRNTIPITQQPTQQSTSSQALHSIISVNDLFGSDEEKNRQRDDEDELTENSTEFEDDDDGDELMEDGEIGPDWVDKENLEFMDEEDIKFYKERMEILSADLRAVTLYKRLCDLQNKARNCFLEPPEEFIFEDAPRSGDDDEQDSCSCARVRMLLNRPKRELVFYDFGGRRTRKSRPITANTACGIQEYSTVDDSIHPQLSLPSSIPMERKVHKYLQIISTIPVEVERRRHRIAQLAYKKGDKATRMFHNCEEIPILAEQKSSKSAEFDESGQRSTQNVPPTTTISLTLKKPKLTTKIAKLANTAINKDLACSSSTTTPMEVDEEESNGDSDASSSTDYPLIPRLKRNKAKKRKRKSVTHSESRRTSIHTAANHDYGSSMFEYESSLMDIGLTNVQNVDCPEIAIPSFRKKDVLDYSLTMPCTNCLVGSDECSTSARANNAALCQWKRIREDHEKMEWREKQRFRACIPNQKNKK